MVIVGHTAVTEEEMLEFIESLERTQKRMREIVGGDSEGGERGSTALARPILINFCRCRGAADP